MAATRSRHPLAIVLGALTAPIGIIAAVAAGIGWLYLLRDVGALAVGPSTKEALPLERLVGEDAQPVLRLVIAWVPTGAVCGLVLAAALGLGPWARALVAGVASFGLLYLVGGVSDAVTASDPLMSHMGSQAGRAALYVAAGLIALGALIPWTTLWSRARGSGEAAAATPLRAPGHEAA